MVNLRRELGVLWLCAVATFLGLLACGRPPTPASNLSLMLSMSAMKLAPGQSGSVRVEVAATNTLSAPVQLTITGEDLPALPTGLTAAFEPEQLTVAPSSIETTTLRLAAAPSAVTGSYSLIVTARSGNNEESVRLKVTLSGAGLGWMRQVSTGGTEVLAALAVDSTGSLYAGGQTTGSFGGQVNAGQFDAFLLKYQPSGALQWAQTLATKESDVITALAIDAADNVYVTGYTYGSFPGYVAAGKADGFVAKYNTSGQKVWLSQIGSVEIDQFVAIAVDPTGGVAVLGATEGGFGLMTNKGPPGTSDVVVVKLTADGKQVFLQQLGTDQNERPAGIAVDPSGAIYGVGSTQGTFPGNTLVGNYDVLLFKLLGDGTQSWLRQTGTPYEDHLAAALIDSKGLLLAAGWTRGGFANQSEMGGQDALLIGYSADGKSQLTRQFGTSYNDQLSGITRVGDSVYTIGSTKGTLPDQIPSGAADVFVARHETNGTIAWLSQLGTDQADSGNAVAATTNDVYVGGTTFGAFSGQTRQGDSDGFIIKLLGAGTAQGY